MKWNVVAASEALGTTPDRLAELWRMLGLQLDPEGLSEDDVELLRVLLEVVRDENGAEEDALLLARSFGHHASRLVTWQVLGMTEALAREHEPAEAVRQAAEVVRRSLPRLERVLVGVWRRHVDAVLDWRLGRDEEQVHELALSVGFVDLVGYTTLTGALSGREVAELVRAFERLCVDVVARHGGRTVKVLGDELLFVTDTARPAALVGLELSRRVEADPRLPSVRVGLATGEVTAVLGDVFGRTVNLAHRLTQAAVPGQVLLDVATAEALRDDAALQVVREGQRRLPGFGDLDVCALVR